MTDVREIMARAIANETGDGFDNAFADKGEWINARGEKAGRFRDVNEPYQCDFLNAADAALAALEAAGFAVVPVEPTEGMIEVGAKAIHDSDDMADTVWPDDENDEGYRGGSGYVRLCRDPEMYRDAARNCHVAMLAAAKRNAS